MSAGSYPFGDVPVSAIADADDPSTPNPFDSILIDPRAQLAYILRAEVLDRDTAWRGDYDGAEEEVYLSSAGYASLGDGGGAAEGIPDHQLFTECLTNPYSVKVNLIASGSWQPSGLPGYGSVTISDPDGRLRHLLKKNWEWRRLTVWVGRRQWIGPSLAEFGRVFSGTVDAVTASMGTITVALRDLRDLLEQDANPDAYLGFGTAVRMKTAGDKVTRAYHARMDWAFALSAMWHGEIIFRAASPLKNAVLLDRAGVLQGRVYSNGAVGALYTESGVKKHMTSAPGLVAAGEVHRLSIALDSDWRGRLFLDGEKVAEDLTAMVGFADFPANGMTFGKPYP